MSAITSDNLLDNLLEYKRLAFENDLEVDDEECKQIAFAICKSDIESKAHGTASEIAKREETPDAYLRSFEANLKVVANSSVTQCARYKKFMKSVKDLNEEQKQAKDESMSRRSINTSQQRVEHTDDGEVEMQVAISDLDPITRGPLEKPCRNKNCNHIYGMDSITEMIRMNPRMRCPIVGCANKQKVALQDLVPDKELERKLVLQRAANS